MAILRTSDLLYILLKTLNLSMCSERPLRLRIALHRPLELTAYSGPPAQSARLLCVRSGICYPCNVLICQELILGGLNAL